MLISKLRTVFLLTTLFCGSAFAQGSQTEGVSEKEIKIGVVNSLSGKNTSGIDMNAGITAAVDEANKSLACGSRKLKVIFYNDSYEPENTLSFTKKLVDEDQVFLLIGYNGTSPTKAILPYVLQTGVPFLFPRTGDEFIRETSAKNIFNLRPSFADEIGSSVKKLLKKGQKKFAVLRQTDAFGDAMKSCLVRALKAADLEDPMKLIVSEGKVLRADQDPMDAFTQIDPGSPEVVILGAAPPAAASFIKLASQKKKNWTYVAPSNTAGIVNLLGDNESDLMITQVVPDFTTDALPVNKQFRTALKNSGLEKNKNSVAFETYINTRVACEAIKRSGKDITREKFVKALEGKYDIGGFKTSWTSESHNNPAHVYVSHVKGKKVSYEE